ncbi:ABC transporter permease [Paractinoplanes hotanensis]|uniref:ABC transporter permease n=1 Tax=Paractinoplanes hotanensis TaxID=2906497 RepID=A0ABT0Y0Z4_9ACTN|nr:ABC transporter permease [Actinoplanes hotanensis]MCM4079632.1 ABC transporter permease [Actinoplanes hotanensis]
MTAVLENTHTPSVRAESSRTVPLSRLTVVELRKLADTRAGLWLLIVIGLATVGTSAIMLGWSPDAEQTFEGFFSFGLLPSAVLLPVLGILSMTAEWSQRTALTTFTLVPARERVIVAKLAAGVIIAVASTVATLVLAAAANLLGAALGADGGWDIAGSLIWQGLAVQIIFVLMGLGFGALLLNSPLAIVGFFALPMVWTILGSTIKALGTAAEWLDINTTTTAMSEAGMTGGEWARVGVSAAVWVLVPLVIGVWRVLRREVS